MIVRSNRYFKGYPGSFLGFTDYTNNAHGHRRKWYYNAKNLVGQQFLQFSPALSASERVPAAKGVKRASRERIANENSLFLDSKSLASRSSFFHGADVRTSIPVSTRPSNLFRDSRNQAFIQRECIRRERRRRALISPDMSSAKEADAPLRRDGKKAQLHV